MSILEADLRTVSSRAFAGPRGGYYLAREAHGVTANDILRAGETDAPEKESKSELVVRVVVPILSAVEQECGQALSRISLGDIVRHAALNRNGTGSRRNFGLARCTITANFCGRPFTTPSRPRMSRPPPAIRASRAYVFPFPNLHFPFP
jgi:hypothetical protein